MSLLMKLLLVLFLMFNTLNAQDLIRNDSFSGVDISIRKYKVNDSVTRYSFDIKTNLEEFDYTIFRKGDNLNYRTSGNVPLQHTFDVIDTDNKELKGIYLEVVLNGIKKTYNINNRKRVK